MLKTLALGSGAALVLLTSATAQGQEFSAAAEDFAAAAESCATLLTDREDPEEFLEASGWEEGRRNAVGVSFTHPQLGVQIIISRLMGDTGCVVDGYLSDKSMQDQLDELIEARFRTRFGDRLKSVFRDPALPGAGFGLDGTIVALSFEDRPAGLSTRITGMNIPEN